MLALFRLSFVEVETLSTPVSPCASSSILAPSAVAAPIKCSGGATEPDAISEASTRETESTTTESHTEEWTSPAWTCVASRKKAATPSSTVSVQARRCRCPKSGVVRSTFRWSSGSPWPKPRSVRPANMVMRGVAMQHLVGVHISPSRNVFPTTFDPWEGTQVGANDFALWTDAKSDRKSVSVLRTNWAVTFVFAQLRWQRNAAIPLCAQFLPTQTHEAGGCADATASIGLCYKKIFHFIDMAIETSSKFPVTKIQTPRYLFFGAPRIMLVTWVNGWLWRLEFEMICWNARGFVTGGLKTKITIWILKPDRVDERLVDTVWLRVKRWVGGHQSLPAVLRRSLYFERYVITEFVLVEGRERSKPQVKDLRQNHERVPVRVTGPR